MSRFDPLAIDRAPSQEAVSLFAFIDGAGPSDWRGLGTGSANPTPIVHRAGSIAAVIGLVPLADYCGAEAERNLADVEWLAPRASHHAAVLHEVMREGAVFPAPFGTLYASLDSLTGFMATHEVTIGQFLREVAGKQEWGLKAMARLDGREVLEAQAASAWPDWSGLTPGVRYMRLCRDRPTLMALARAQVARAVADRVEELAPPAVAMRQLGGRRLSDGGDELVASYALLVPDGEAAALGERVAQLGAVLEPQGAALSLTGPWPAFSFRPDLHPPPPTP